MSTITVMVLGVECQIEFYRYPSNGRVAIELVSERPECPGSWKRFVTVTVNLPNISQCEKEVFVKTWSENEGILEALVAAKVLRDTQERLAVGGFGAKAAVAELLITPPKFENKILTADHFDQLTMAELTRLLEINQVVRISSRQERRQRSVTFNLRDAKPVRGVGKTLKGAFRAAIEQLL